MKEFKITPIEWSDLTSRDKRTLGYHLIMENYYTDQINVKNEREAKMAQQKQDFINNLPKQETARGR